MLKFDEQISLADHTTLRVGGPARYLFFITSENELLEALLFAEKKNLPIHVLGGGSNTLFSDNGFSGVVVKMGNTGIVCSNTENGYTICVVEAGEVWNDVVQATVHQGFFGMEYLSAIPGTVGGAVAQNIGAYGSEVKDSISWVEVYDCEKRKIVRLSCDMCAFGYRESVFKKTTGRYIILRAAFLLSREMPQRTLHKEIITELERAGTNNYTPRMLAEAVVRVRARKLPDWREIGTAGSFFKNPVVDKEAGKHVLEIYPEAIHTILPDGRIKFAAGWLIDHAAGLRGVREGNVGTWENQALVIVNEGRENGEEIRAFVRKVQIAVYEKTRIHLEPEVVMVE